MTVKKNGGSSPFNAGKLRNPGDQSVAKKELFFNNEQLQRIIAEFPTPFHLYDERGIRSNARLLNNAFQSLPGYREYYALKACPNPHIVNILKREGFGLDCSSYTELLFAEKMGFSGEDIMYTSNDTSAEEFTKASQLKAIINLDDITHIDLLLKTSGVPEIICFRYNPGEGKEGNSIIGKPIEAKFGMTRDQIFTAYERMQKMGVKRFGLHTMVASNVLDPSYIIETVRMLFDLALELEQRLGITLEFVNVGGGIGIPYSPEQNPMDVASLGREVKELHDKMLGQSDLRKLKVYSEFGRMITGPFGCLVTEVLHIKDTYKKFVGVDATMANLMRPALYGAYHHITVMGKEDQPCDMVYDVTGSLCENNDKFAINRSLPQVEIGDILVIHDTGAHGHAMGFNYNGKLRSAELLLCENGEIKLIRRAETPEDYFSTLDFDSVS